MTKQLYVNTVEIMNLFNGDNYDKLINGDIVEFPCDKLIEDLHKKNLIKYVYPKYAENDKYLVPIYVQGVLVNEFMDTLYFVDEFNGSGEDKVSFVGGVLQQDIIEEWGDYLSVSLNHYIKQQMTRSHQSHNTIQLDFISTLREYLYISPNNYNITFKYCQFREDGFYFYTEPIIIEHPGNKLVQLSYNTYRPLKLLRDRDRWNIDYASKEICSVSENDCRITEFDRVGEVLEFVQVLYQNEF